MDTQSKSIEQLQAENRRMIAVLRDIADSSNCPASSARADRVLGAIGAIGEADDIAPSRPNRGIKAVLMAIALGIAAYLICYGIGSL